MRTHYKGTRGHRRKAGARWIGVGTGHPTGLGRSRPALLESLEGRTLLSTVIAEDFSAGASGFAAAGGTWSASAGAYGVTTPDASATTHLNTRSIHPTAVDGDFVLAADASVTGTASTWNDFAVIFGYQDTNNYYFFSSNESNDAATSGLFRVTSGVSTELADATAPITAGSTYQVRVEKSGDQVTAYRNGTPVATARGVNFATGQVGFGSKGDQATFDNLTVTDSAAPDPLPAAPSDTLATVVSTSRIDLSWTDNSQDETGFKIERSTDMTQWTDAATVGAGTTAYSVQGLSPSTTYYFRVRALGATGTSDPSNVAGAKTLAAPAIEETFDNDAGGFTDVDGTWAVANEAYVVTSAGAAATTHLNTRSVAPTVLGGDFTLTADASVTGTASTWNDFAVIFSYQDTNNYYFFSSNESNDAATSGLFKVVNGVSTQLADVAGGISANTVYQVRVERTGDQIRAYRGGVLVASAADATFTSGRVGFGSKGDIATFDNLVATGTVVTDPSPAPVSIPSAPSTLAAAAGGSTVINLTWSDNSADESGFKVERSTDGTTFTQIGTVGANVKAFSASGLTPSTTYQFRVRAYNSAGDSPYSNVSSAATTAAPQQGAKPGPDNTGVRPGTALTSRGTLTITAGGTAANPVVYENLDVSGRIDIKADYVILRNVRVTSPNQTYSIFVQGGSDDPSLVLIEDVEMSGGIGCGIGGTGFTLRRADIFGTGADGINPYSDAVIESSWIHEIAKPGLHPAPHADGIQMTHGSNVVIRGNFIDVPINAGMASANSCIFLKSDTGPINNVTIEGNWLNGGNYTIYSRTANGNGAPTNVRVINNRFGRDYRYALYSFDGPVQTSGNVWDNTGAPAA